MNRMRSHAVNSIEPSPEYMVTLANDYMYIPDSRPLWLISSKCTKTAVWTMRSYYDRTLWQSNSVFFIHCFYMPTGTIEAYTRKYWILDIVDLSQHFLITLYVRTYRCSANRHSGEWSSRLPFFSLSSSDTSRTTWNTSASVILRSILRFFPLSISLSLPFI